MHHSTPKYCKIPLHDGKNMIITKNNICSYFSLDAMWSEMPNQFTVTVVRQNTEANITVAYTQVLEFIIDGFEQNGKPYRQVLAIAPCTSSIVGNIEERITTLPGKTTNGIMVNEEYQFIPGAGMSHISQEFTTSFITGNFNQICEQIDADKNLRDLCLGIQLFHVEEALLKQEYELGDSGTYHDSRVFAMFLLKIE